MDLKPFYCIASQECRLIGFLLVFLVSRANTGQPVEPKPLSDQHIQLLANPDSEPKLFESTLDGILIPRIPGSDGQKKVQEFIHKTMHFLQWNVSLDTFQDQTPFGKIEFTNIVATLNPTHCRRLVLACHYDSKLILHKTFLGAIDSAVPCAMLIHLATTLDKYLKELALKSDLTLQLIFFDGEEALVNWTNDDSLYGSRHLADKWSRAPFPPELRSTCNSTDNSTELDRIELFMLLDLLGANNPQFHSFFPNTHPLYARLVQIEHKLNELALLEKIKAKPSQYFSGRQVVANIADDHIPFLRRNVSILYVTAAPFPKVWHTESDNKQNLDFATIRDLLKIFRVFVAQYLHLTVS